MPNNAVTLPAEPAANRQQLDRIEGQLAELHGLLKAPRHRPRRRSTPSPRPPSTRATRNGRSAGRAALGHPGPEGPNGKWRLCHDGLVKIQTRGYPS